jgi:methylisocitrate lyase
MTKGELLRQTLQKPGILVLPGVYDCIGARLVERLGFEVVFTSGYGISASSLGKPDYGLLTATEMAYSVGRIIESTRLPVVADVDTGYGNPLNVLRTVSEIVKLGAGGIILEDQEWPKRCGHMAGKSVIPMEEQVEKIHAAVEAREESGLVIVGRTDARACLGLEEAIRRGRSYFEAGADVVFIEAPESEQDLREICGAFPDVPLFANMIEGGKTPLLSADALGQLGFKIVVFPLAGLFAATRAQEAALKHLRERGTTSGFGEMFNFKDFESVVDLESYRKTEKKYTSTS